jgi:hypothetical protein
MSVKGGPNTVTSGLVLELDAGNIKSYQSGSTTWLDKSGFANNGTLINGPTFNTGSGGSIVFDGADDYMNCGTSDLFNLSGNYTLSLWLKTVVTFDTTIIQRYLNSPSYPGYALNINRSSPGTLDFYTGGVWYTSKGSNVNSGNWNNIVTTVNSTTCVIYQNLISTSFTVAASNSNPGDTLFIASLEGTAGNFPGSIALFQIYNRALTADEVLQNYNATKGRFGL